MNQVVTDKVELISLNEAIDLRPYKRESPELRCRQEELSAFKRMKRSCTSLRALELYSNYFCNKKVYFK
ncbi:hypothetical protein AKJ62_05065 [candidate division MSBL1 archaeon SCGC-AAA259D14]|uniref:Uncharacterized protein n=4 Tax=candidate division MSBL1 TaxID=215777 RepID=A0A133UR51_9EURY|nr:hypothetical protein AKJ62_05065 [candidate division MSBL1 archaeon SCGC-AAA259D14]KXA92694.1 hypothetical protein AKJ66_03685 [candidate division MSBL1 archaeon SCGC-AAA259E22]KXA95188.1 hypothetical protein AKJ36_01305 [candidate division MSBL1 archaeon SCGC-AAA259I07]KXA96695.1 hypothetical protein AKJ38_02790 [candidate division MSBL1 archaeon SCGC-AAA259I14]